MPHQKTPIYHCFAALLFCLLPAFSFAQQSGIITGTVVDKTGAAIPGARVKLSMENQAAIESAVSGSDSHFSLTSIVPGPFTLSISASGFASRTLTGVLHPSETLTLPQTILQVATLTTDVEVRLTQSELAEEQIKSEEKQRLGGIIPNYFVNYVPNAAPLTPRQKFELEWKTAFDPVTFGINGIIAGVEQARNDYPGFGLGAKGYAKRYGASYGNFITATVLSSVVFPSIFKQDTRYFYKGVGSKPSRLRYALARSVICQGDNGRPQFAYARILGDLAAGGISNFYYPAKDRDGASLTFQNAAIGIGAEAIANIFQEFVARKLTPKKSRL